MFIVRAATFGRVGSKRPKGDGGKDVLSRSQSMAKRASEDAELLDQGEPSLPPSLSLEDAQGLGGDGVEEKLNRLRSHRLMVPVPESVYSESLYGGDERSLNTTSVNMKSLQTTSVMNTLPTTLENPIMMSPAGESEELEVLQSPPDLAEEPAAADDEAVVAAADEAAAAGVPDMAAAAALPADGDAYTGGYDEIHTAATTGTEEAVMTAEELAYEDAPAAYAAEEESGLADAAVIDQVVDEVVDHVAEEQAAAEALPAPVEPELVADAMYAADVPVPAAMEVAPAAAEPYVEQYAEDVAADAADDYADMATPVEGDVHASAAEAALLRGDTIEDGALYMTPAATADLDAPQAVVEAAPLPEPELAEALPELAHTAMTEEVTAAAAEPAAAEAAQSAWASVAAAAAPVSTAWEQASACVDTATAAVSEAPAAPAAAITDVPQQAAAALAAAVPEAPAAMEAFAAATRDLPAAAETSAIAADEPAAAVPEAATAVPAAADAATPAAGSAAASGALPAADEVSPLTALKATQGPVSFRITHADVESHTSSVADPTETREEDFQSAATEADADTKTSSTMAQQGPTGHSSKSDLLACDITLLPAAGTAGAQVDGAQQGMAKAAKVAVETVTTISNWSMAAADGVVASAKTVAAAAVTKVQEEQQAAAKAAELAADTLLAKADLPEVETPAVVVQSAKATDEPRAAVPAKRSGGLFSCFTCFAA